jgi:hypothetical protein
MLGGVERGGDNGQKMDEREKTTPPSEITMAVAGEDERRGVGDGGKRLQEGWREGDRAGAST